ncbi:MAG TPA: hypothetical protein VFJ30_01505 [Phycisphaerae bacterium]|nr:hypothetical protein [Phycisphaerae bacterium]
MIINTLAETRQYYMIERTWLNPAKGSEERRMEGMLDAAAAAVASLQQRGGLSEPEAKLLELDIRGMPHVGNFRSRTVTDYNGSALLHTDSFVPPPADRSSNELHERMPWLRELARLTGRNPVTVRAAIDSSARRIQIVESAEGYPLTRMLESLTERTCRGGKLQTFKAQGEEAKRYIARIIANHPMR